MHEILDDGCVFALQILVQHVDDFLVHGLLLQDAPVPAPAATIPKQFKPSQ